MGNYEKVMESLQSQVSEKSKKILEITNEIKRIEIVKNDLPKLLDFCPCCYGKGVYVDDKAYMRDTDPHKKSSDHRHNCPRCKGKGNYVGTDDGVEI